MTTAGTGDALATEDSPLEIAVNNSAFFLADGEPMGVVAEVIRNDMGDSLGIVVYDDTTKQVHRFRSSQVVVRPDGAVTVLPSWFRKSREILHKIEPMEQAVPAIRRARRKGAHISQEEVARATAEAPAEVQRFIDEAVILRSQLIGKLHGIFEKQAAAEAQLREASSPGLFDRTPEADRILVIQTLRRSQRLNNQTIKAMRDFMVRMDASVLFPKDPRPRALLRYDVPEAHAGAIPVPEEGAMEEFETFEDAEEFQEFESADEFETFEDAEEFQEFAAFDEEFTSVEETPLEAVPMPPPPPAPVAQSPAFAYDQVEALPDADDMTVTQPSLMTVGAPGWSPPQPGGGYDRQPAVVPYGSPLPPPPPATGPRMDALEVSAQRKIEGQPAVPEPVAKKAGLLGRLRKGKEKRERPSMAPPPMAAAPGVVAAPGPAEEVEEFETFEEAAPEPPARAAPAPSAPVRTPLPPPPSLPPPPAYAPHVDTFESVDELETFEEAAPIDEFAPVEATPPPAAAWGPPPSARAPPPPAPAPVAEAVDEFETFEEEPVEEFSASEEEPRELDAEKDIDAILAMALGKAPPPKSRPTARPGVREEIGSPMQSILAKTKYRRT